MHNGEKQEYGSAENIFYRPQHPYTKSLLQAIPRLDKNQHTLSTVSDAATNTEQEPVVSAKKKKHKRHSTSHSRCARY
ncbi:oligopeptide/dipeptide ABC transporter ATP-binding protein [Saccharobesus litoralis]|uniref:oligopeptide/dipeptide ABC transporter ATP-binding protein n=1 Tax=Saccharobesus litoralis TaxID=2172099 RepID=UPI002E31A87E|nr:oligopeptide/dipeptide ABC transporter ATP-binding protein [Saccharobesus litoralis]